MKQKNLLAEMLRKQKKFTQQFIQLDGSLTNEERAEYTRQYVLNAMEELTEIAKETNIKHHKNQHSINEAKIKEEIIDALKYVFNLCLIWDMAPKDIHRIFNAKSNLVEQKYKLESYYKELHDAAK